MGQEESDRAERPGPAPEPFDEFSLREYPAVVGLLQGLLRSRLVAEELAQETFLVAYRDWGRVSGLDNPRAWIRKVALNQRGSFLRAYLRQQAREQRSVAHEEDDTIKLADDHAEVWQAIRTLPPSQAQVIALHYYEDYSVSQIAAALGRAPGTIKAQLHQGRRRRAGCFEAPSGWSSSSTSCWSSSSASCWSGWPATAGTPSPVPRRPPRPPLRALSPPPCSGAGPASPRRAWTRPNWPMRSSAA